MAVFFEKLNRAYELSKACYRIVFYHKHLIWFPLLSSISCVLILISMGFWVFTTPFFDQIVHEIKSRSLQDHQAEFYTLTFIFYLVNYFVIFFFNSALMACTLRILNGQEASVSFGISMATKRITQIFAWALVSATIGLVLKVISDKSNLIGKIISALLGGAWTVLSYFVVPYIIVQGASPWSAFSKSSKLIYQKWGDALRAEFSFLILSGAAMFCWFIFLSFCAFFFAQTHPILLAVMGITGFIVIHLITSTAEGIFRGVLFNYATGRELPIGLQMYTEDFQNHFQSKRLED
ncbi:MAG: hypothetical protein J0L93_08695 [Deltaproteobacteria bacterium]|nr:hypothetical protein [Deltaproteobacteria bacterium]